LSLAAALMCAALAVTMSHNATEVSTRKRDLDVRLSEGGLVAGDAILIRIFKEESELELWMSNGTVFQLFATYPICYWSGKLGPKEREGDRQAPEGFYEVKAGQLRLTGRHPRSIDIGFPNAFDRSLGRTGSLILVHGGCTSIGCFAMTDAVMGEIYDLAEQAIGNGQAEIQVQIFPFRMGEEKVAAHAGSSWYGFWRNLKEGYDAFELTHVPPRIAACGGRYLIGSEPLLAQRDGADAFQHCDGSEPMMASPRLTPAPRRIGRRMAKSRPYDRSARHRTARIRQRGDKAARGARRVHTTDVSGAHSVR
jgi:murein L,D-transpeptidase YafK